MLSGRDYRLNVINGVEICTRVKCKGGISEGKSEGRRWCGRGGGGGSLSRTTADRSTA